MATTRGRIDQPKGGKITVGPEERAHLKKLRLAKGLKQDELGDKVGASQGTISNMESGRHPQITAEVYAGLYLILTGGPAPVSDSYVRIVRGAPRLLEEDASAIADLIDKLAAKSRP